MSAPSPTQPTAPDRDTTVDFAIAVERLRQLGITVCHSNTMAMLEVPAAWVEHTMTIYLHPDATFWAKLFVLADLHALHTRPDHISPSVPTPRLTLVRSPDTPCQTPDRHGIPRPRPQLIQLQPT